MAKEKQELEVEGRKIAVSNLDKILYPAARFTKGQVIDYYIRVSPYLLPHVKDRPVTLLRYPDGVGKDFFYEKDAPKFTPEWVQTFPVPRRDGGPDINYILINDLATLVWLANLANLEIHPFLHRVPDLNTPLSVVFDLDPGEGATVLECARVAILLRDLFAELGLQAFAKVSGSKGLQVYVPLNTPVTYEQTRPFAHAIARLMEARHRDLVVSEMPKHLRAGKVFIDWSQNADFKTTVSVYSLRAKTNRPYVSMPVEWNELSAAISDGDPQRLYWGPKEALARLEEVGDLFEPVLGLRQRLPEDVQEYLKRTQPRASTKAPESLARYKSKRDFAKTPEPAPDLPRRSRQGSRRRFVIQKHAASHLHYDFRLEMHDVLKSWAVPKGPPYELDQPRLAMPTEDHPIEYLDFEGVIPKGQYGGGTVMVWDIGTYELIEGNYYKGFLHIHLDGKKLKGEWTLQRAREKDREVWFLRKTDKAMRPPPKTRENVSALSGRSMEEIARDPSATWQSNRAQGKPELSEPDLSSLPEAKLPFIPPMLAKAVKDLPDGPEWMYEIKLDGYRATVLKANDKIKLFSRRGNLLNNRFPSIASAFDGLPEGTMLDGEVVALDDEGRPSFNRLQRSQDTPTELYYYAFDLLIYKGRDTRGLLLSERRQLLEQFALSGLADPVRLSNRIEASASDLLAAAREQGLEGVIAKRLDSRYESGDRSGAWVKTRTSQGQELVIGGYLPGKDGFESLLVGYHDKPGGKLMFLGKVRNGFTPQLRREVAQRFQGLETDKCPFANLPEPKNARRGEALTREAMKRYRWLKPQLVAHIEFADWTAADHLRHSRFGGLRDDKDAKDVVKETF